MTSRRIGSKNTRIPGSGQGSRVAGSGSRKMGTKGSRPISQPRGKKRGAHGCEGNDGTCGAYPVKGTHLCVGHTRSQAVSE